MDWIALRSEFPVTRHWAFFDHAGVAPITGRAQQALVDWASDMAENGDVHEAQWMQRVEAVRHLAGQQEHERGDRHRGRGVPMEAR
jgi:cysteine desulfurase/selenocysteine lyase